MSSFNYEAALNQLANLIDIVIDNIEDQKKEWPLSVITFNWFKSLSDAQKSLVKMDNIGVILDVLCVPLTHSKTRDAAREIFASYPEETKRELLQHSTVASYCK